MAEVLITLGIIGVVVAIIIPSIIQSYDKSQTITKLKKAYSVLGQVVTKSFADNGPVNFVAGETVNGADVEQFFQTYWLPYFNGAVVSQDRIYPYGNVTPYKYVDNSVVSTGVYTSFGEGRVYLTTPDGISYLIIFIDWKDVTDENGNTTSILTYNSMQKVYVDINGTKRPNRLGKDVFIFLIDFNSNVVRSWSYDSLAFAENNCKTKGESCSTKIITDGWQIKYDYPW